MNRLAESVRVILLHDWDPIGVQEFPEDMKRRADDEYDAYVPTVVAMIKAQQSVQEILDYLHKAEVDQMGIRRDVRLTEPAARKLSNLSQEFR